MTLRNIVQKLKFPTLISNIFGFLFYRILSQKDKEELEDYVKKMFKFFDVDPYKEKLSFNKIAALNFLEKYSREK